jgi:predicted nucleic acid-binding protein
MATYLLDTNVIIDALNQKKGRNAFLLDLAEQGHTLACCAVSVAEIYAGVRMKEELRTLDLLSSLQFFPITFRVAELAGRLKQLHGRRGKTLSIPDTMIAAVALDNQLILLTDNVKDFPMKELRLQPLPQT